MGESLTPCQETKTFLGTSNLIILLSNFFFLTVVLKGIVWISVP